MSTAVVFRLSVALCLVSVGWGAVRIDNPLSHKHLHYFDVFKLLRLIAAETDGNFAFSPSSLSKAFEMLYQGAMNRTALELVEVFAFDELEQPEEALQHSGENLQGKASVLDAANAILVREGLELKRGFKQVVETEFQALVEQVDFGKKDQVLQRVNSWVKEKTRGKIDRLLEDVSNDDALLVLSAAYFKGFWLNPFYRERTWLTTFYGSGYKEQEVSMMSQVLSVKYVADDRLQVLELPYDNNSTKSMVIILPKLRDGLGDVEELLTLEAALGLRWKMKKTRVSFGLPRFRVQFMKDMAGCFEKLGMSTVFGDKADFSGIGRGVGKVNKVIHKVVIEVNEEGTEAAGSSGVKSVSRVKEENPRPVPFIADHPFLFAVLNGDAILFLGRVSEADPSWKSL